MNFPGANNINGGVMLALSGLDTIQISADNSTVEVGPGLRWFDVYSYLEPYGRIVIGGRLKTIGVPGLTLIGGVHYFANKYGYAMDNVVSYDVVLGNGTQVTATANSSSDLFWALKGGANNFGVVTKFTLKTLAIPQVSTTIQVFNESGVQSFIKAACDLAQVDDASIAAGAVITINYNATTKVVSASLLGVQEGTESPPSRFANFSAIPADRVVNNVSSMATFAAQLDSPLQMFRPDADQLYLFYQIWKAAVDEIADVDGLYPTFVMNLDPASANTIAKNNGVGNVWGADDTDSAIWYQTSTGWNLAKDDLRVQTWSHQLTAKLHALNQAKGISTEFIYMGDAGEDQDPWVGMPVKNVEKMKTIRAKYDVGGVFTYLNWGGFKLPN
ncbi:FAD binding domain protein [Rutstroemia sp. NJR-2017a BVV2]|nr:FAD binding domain protein [Rutstroemia sp. NJR-2017a BVV2]